MIQNTDYLVNNHSTQTLQTKKIVYKSSEPLDWIQSKEIHTVDNIIEIGITAKNTELWIYNNKDTCVLVLGESWSYGDRLHDADGGIRVDSKERQDDLSFRLNNIFAGYCAKLLDADLYLCAVPGCNNTELVFHLPNILNFLSQHYNKIKVLFQITSPGRCFSSPKWNRSDHYYKNYMSNSLGAYSQLENKFNMKEWASVYELQLINLINSFCDKYSADFFIWRNFNKVLNQHSNVLQISWLEQLCKMYSYNLTLPLCNETEWWQVWSKKIPCLDITTEEILKQLDCIEKFTEFLHQVPVCHWHPQITAHWVWAITILNATGWYKI